VADVAAAGASAHLCAGGFKLHGGIVEFSACARFFGHHGYK